MFRLVRLTRLLKLVRSIEHFDVLVLMVTAIKKSLLALGWSMMLLFTAHMIVALCICNILHMTYFPGKEAHADETTLEVYEYFGTFTRAMTSTFELTLANWPVICRLLSEEISEWFSLWVLVHRFALGIAVIGVLNGIFMQETLRAAASDDDIMVRTKERHRKMQRKKLADLFDILDHEADGKITIDEFNSIATSHTVRTWLAAMELSTDDLDNLFWLIDVDNSGGVTLDELMAGVDRLRGTARSLDLVTVMKHLHLNTSMPERLRVSVEANSDSKGIFR